MASIRDQIAGGMRRLTGGRWSPPAGKASVSDTVRPALDGISLDKRQPYRSEPPDGNMVRLQAALGKEIGTSGLQIFGGYVRAAYTPELQWPAASTVYNDMRRRVPTIRALLNAITMLAHQAKWKFEGATDSGPDTEAADFGNEVLADMEGGFDQFVQDALTALAFGWSWHEINYNRRDPNWRPPDPDDEYRSRFDDSRIGWRNLAYRRQSSFLRWEANDKTRRVSGLWQIAPPNPQVLLPLEKAVHFIPFRDGDNPEGQCLMESSYKAYYYATNYEIILGVGTERSLVGWPVIAFDDKPEQDDLDAVKRMVATLLAGSEKGYLTEPPGIHLRFENVKNDNAPVLLDIIKFYYVSMLQTVLADFIWLGAGERGSWSLGQDKSALFIMAVNGLLDALADCLQAGAVKRLFRYNDFPGITETPRLTHSGVHKPVPLDVLGAFITAIAPLITLSDDDQVNIRLATDGLLSKQATSMKNATPAQPKPDGNMAPADKTIGPDGKAVERKPASKDNTAADVSDVGALADGEPRIQLQAEVIGLLNEIVTARKEIAEATLRTDAQSD